MIHELQVDIYERRKVCSCRSGQQEELTTVGSNLGRGDLKSPWMQTEKRKKCVGVPFLRCWFINDT